jgi:hypothetical protein
MEPQEIEHHKRSKGHDAYKRVQNIEATPPRIWIIGVEFKTNRPQMFLQLNKKADTKACN